MARQRLRHFQALQASDTCNLTQDCLFLCLPFFVFFVAQPKEKKTASRPKTLAQLRMQLKAEREAEGQLSLGGHGGETWTGGGPAAKSHLKELTRLMDGAKTEAGKNFSQLLQKLDNIKQVGSRRVVGACE